MTDHETRSAPDTYALIIGKLSAIADYPGEQVRRETQDRLLDRLLALREQQP